MDQTGSDNVRKREVKKICKQAPSSQYIFVIPNNNKSTFYSLSEEMSCTYTDVERSVNLKRVM